METPDFSFVVVAHQVRPFSLLMPNMNHREGWLYNQQGKFILARVLLCSVPYRQSECLLVLARRVSD